MNNFNFLAPVYDALAQLAFGQTLYMASVHFLDRIPAGSKVLVLGGGTGKLLPKLKECEVFYVEKSTQMLERAKKREAIGRVHFIEADFLKWQTDQQFEVVICPFFLDVFTETNLKQVIQKIRALTTEHGQLIVADFQQTGQIQHGVLLTLMHWFFWITARLEGRKLMPINTHVLQHSYEIEDFSTFSKAFVFSAIYLRLNCT